jgi:hypothetical protein
MVEEIWQSPPLKRKMLFVSQHCYNTIETRKAKSITSDFAIVNYISYLQ